MKYKAGQVLQYNGILYKVRQVSKIGWEGSESPYFYDLQDNAGNHITIPISNIDNPNYEQDIRTITKDDYEDPFIYKQEQLSEEELCQLQAEHPVIRSHGISRWLQKLNMKRKNKKN